MPKKGRSKLSQKKKTNVRKVPSTSTNINELLDKHINIDHEQQDLNESLEPKRQRLSQVIPNETDSQACEDLISKQELCRDESRRIILANKATCRRTAREEEHEEESQARLGNLALHARATRAEEDEVERQVRLNNMILNARVTREQENDEARQARLEDVALRAHIVREEQTEAERQVRLNNMAVRARRRRHIVLRPTHLAATGDVVDVHYIGEMNVEWPHCSALNFRQEATTHRVFPVCCKGGNVDLDPLGPYPDLLQS